LIFDAYLLCANGVMDVAGFMYRVIVRKEFDGALFQTYDLQKA